jgi:hypothetical protein
MKNDSVYFPFNNSKLGDSSIIKRLINQAAAAGKEHQNVRSLQFPNFNEFKTNSATINPYN